MNVFARSMGNAFRNKVRSGAVIVILTVAIGLALSMLVANQAVAGKVDDLKASIGNTITVNPAGARGFEGGGEPLTTEDSSTAAGVDHVSGVTGSLSLQLSNQDESTTSEDSSSRGGPGGSVAGTTSLQSAVEPGTLGARNNGTSDESSESGESGESAEPGGSGSGTGTMPAMPLTATGVEAPVDAQGGDLNITEGSGFANYGADSAEALLGTTLAEKNGLSVGSTFTALDRTFTVSGIFDAGTDFDNNTLYLPLAAAQELSGQTGELSVLTVTVDSIENVEATQAALEEALGSDRVDVTLGSSGVSETIESLESVETISLIGFIAALVTAALIVLLIMIMVVRERRREIGVLKAIGASNRSVAVQFVLEALVLVLVAAVLGAGVAFLSSGTIANALVDSGNDAGSTSVEAGPGGTPPDGAPSGMEQPPSGEVPAEGFGGGPGGFDAAADLIGNVTASVGPGTLALGILGVLFVAVLGALVPALLTAKIRPVEVLRGE